MDFLLAMTLPAGWQIGIVLALLVLAVVLFANENLSVDLTTLLLLLVLIGSGILTVREAFAGYSSDIIIMLASIFILSGALQETGALDALGARMLKVATGGENRLLVVLTTVTSGLSAFMNNTVVTAMFVGPVMGIAQRARLSPSKLLIPLAYASILGGTCTLIGTSTNIAVSNFIAGQNLRPVGLFEITPVGLVLVAVGLTYLLLVARRILPAHPEESLTEGFSIRNYLSEIVVMRGSQLIGQRVFQSDLSNLDFRVLKIMRGKQTLTPHSDTEIAQGDVLLVTGNVENLIKVKTTEGIEIRADLRLGDQDLQSDDLKVAEALVTPQSVLVGRTLREANFQQQSGLVVLAIYRRGRSLREQIGSIKLKVGDLLLVQGHKDRLQSIRRNRELAVLQELGASMLRPQKGYYVAGFFVLALLLGGFEIMPVSMAFLCAAVATLLFRCVPVERAYQFIDWRLLILIGGMTAFGTAMVKTGAAELLAGGIVSALEPFGVMPILAGFVILTILLTQPMSNAAAALVVLPVALHAARVLGANERTFAIGIMLGASVSLITPFEPSCILVYGPGKYTFRDFVKSGAPLTAVLTAIVLLLLPVFWPLHGPTPNVAPGNTATNRVESIVSPTPARP
jgi:di/tricarboxylate transporter